MNNRKKRPVCIRLSGAVILCVLTFALGYLLPSFFMLDARIESANGEISSLKDTINEKNGEIKSLKDTVKLRDEANIALGEKITENLSTIEELNARIADLEGDVELAANAAVSGINSASERNTIANSMSHLSTTQQLILLLALFLVFIIIVSASCVLISSFKRKKNKKDEEDEDDEIEEITEEQRQGEIPGKFGDTRETKEDIAEKPKEEAEERSEKETPAYDVSLIERAVGMLYANSLEDNVSSLGGFRFGVTNFEEILSDKAKGKSFGNSEDGDFIAFMENSSGTKKLYIIPRYLNLSESAVTLRGTTDLFDITDENGKAVTGGSVKIKSVESPSVFAFGESGWGIESKGLIVALGHAQKD